MMVKQRNIGVAMGVFLALTTILLWLTGGLRLKADDVVDGKGDHHDDHCAVPKVKPTACAPDESAPQAGCEAGEESPCGSRSPAVPEDWCGVHNVKESACTRCNPSLIPVFKAKGDWCAGHALPESQCVQCNPGLGGETLDLKNLEQRRCEHDVQTMHCDRCRFEIGMVKLAPAVAKSLVTIGTVVRQQMVSTLTLTGEIGLDQTRAVDVPPVAAGRVVKTHAFLGQRVDEGELLAVLHSSEFGQAKVAYLHAFTRHEIAEEERRRQLAINAAVELFLEKVAGDPIAVQQGEAVQDKEASGLIGPWKSRLVDAASRSELAQSVFTREDDLYRKQISSRMEWEHSRQELRSARAAYAALVEEMQLDLKLDKLRAENAWKAAAAELRATQHHLHLFGLDDAAIQAVQTTESGSDFALLAVKAPRAGTLIAQNISDGKYVTPDQSLYTLVDLDNLWVWCDVYERDLSALNRAMESQTVAAVVRVDAFGAEIFPGTLDLMGSAVDAYTRTVRVRVQVKDPRNKLKAGMFAKVELALAHRGEVTAVPKNAVVSDDGRHFVFQQFKDDLWVRRDVVTGKEVGDLLEIISGVEPGALVVASGAFMLKSDVLREKMGAGCAD